MRRHLSFAMLCVFAAGCSETSAPPEPEPTPLRLDAPQRRALVQQTTSHTTLNVLGERILQEYKEDIRITLDIGAANAQGVAEFEATFDYMSLELESDLFEKTDSGMDPAAMAIRPLREALRAGQGLAFTGTVTDRGRIQELNGLEELRAQVLETVSARTLPPELMGTTVVEDAVNAIYDESTLSREIEISLLPRPLEPLTEAFTWSDRSVVSLGIAEPPSDVTYTVKTVSPASIEILEEVHFVLDDASAAAMKATMSPNAAFDATAKGGGSGNYKIDPVSGWMSTYTQNLRVNGTYDFDGFEMTFTGNVIRRFETFAE